MTPVRKLGVASILGGILAMQLLTGVPKGLGGGWFWPFVDFPMYSGPHRAGEEVGFRRLEAIPCNGERPVSVAHWDLGVHWFDLDGLLRQTLDPPEADRAEPSRKLGALVREVHGNEYCTIRVYERRIRVDEVSAGATDVPWRIEAELELR